MMEKNNVMNTIQRFLVAVLLMTAALFHTSCEFRDTPVNKLSEESIWSSNLLLDEYTLSWYRNMNDGFSVYMPTTALIKGLSREYLPWYGDQITVSKTDWYTTAYGDILKSSIAEITRKGLILWTKYYTQIQSVNRLLENQGKIADGDFKNRVLGEAHFFRAYYYYLLLQRFGGVLIIEKNYDPIRDTMKFPRASFQEMVQFINREAEFAVELLPVKQESASLGRVTQGAARMLKAKTYLWASSSVFQHVEKNFLGFVDDQSQAMLSAARAEYEELMKLPYELMPLSGTTQEEISESYHQIFLTKNSGESILEVQHSDDGNFSTGYGHKLDRDAAPSSCGGTTAAYTPTQNHVDEYGMVAGAVYDPENPYLNRDYRFYANVVYDGCTFRGQKMEIHYNKIAGKEVAAADLSPYGSSVSAAVTKTGYYMRKFINESQKIDNDAVYGSSQNYIIWRYAEAILDYAEVLYRQGHTDLALVEVNKIRDRAKMPRYESLSWEELVNERRVEMAFEETTYWDMFRWGIAYEKMRGETNPLKAMKIVLEEGKAPVYKISNMNKYPKRVREFRTCQYYLPIPWDEVRFQEIEQNPEWVEQ